MPPALRCGSSNRSDGVWMRANGKPPSSQMRSSSAIGCFFSKRATSGINVVARERALVVGGIAGSISSASPSALREDLPLPLGHDADENRTPSLDSKMSYTPHARLPADIGSGSLPVTACCIMCVETSQAAFSKRPLCTYWPLPRAVALAQRRHHRDRAEHAAHHVVHGRAGAQRPAAGPVMYASPLIICTTSSSAVRFS